MSAEEVLSADQRKPENLKMWRAGWLLAAVLIAVMWFGNHEGRVENVWLLGTSGAILFGLVADAWARKRGYK